MKYEKEATTKNGRRTWKVTYELVRGPEPKPQRKAEQPAIGTAQKSQAKKGSPAAKPKRERAEKDAGQLGFF